jgi:hypothetical protein
MSAPDKPVDVAALWEAEANWAVREWRALFEPEQKRLKREPGAISGSRVWLMIGAAAKRSFETISDQLLQRVRDLLAKRDDPDHIGSPDLAAAAIVRPLTQCALEAMRHGERAARERRSMAVNMYVEPLTKAGQEIQRVGSELQTTLAREISIRLSQIDAAKKKAERRLESAVLGDFVLLSKTALSDGHKDVAAVLAAAALEDCLKRFALRHGINVDGPSMQDIVNALKGKGLVTGSQKTLLETMPKLRDYAMHANWAKVDSASVGGMIGFVEQFLIDHFS